MSELLDRRIYRQLAASDAGPVYTFDIDKTYLDTHLSQARSLLSIPLEGALDKHPYAGMAELIRACQRGSDQVGADRPAFFVSASPRQMRKVLERRMELDEIAVDGLTLKSWGYYLKRGRIRMLTHQVPYKLTALLLTRAELPPGCREVLFGDDSEADSLIYSLYAAILTRAVRLDDLDDVLGTYQVGAQERQPLHELIAAMGPAIDRLGPQPVHAVFIHGVRREPRELLVERKGVAPVRYSTALYPAACLYRDGYIAATGLRSVYAAVRSADAWMAAEARDQVEPILRVTDPDWKTNLFGGDWLT